MTIEIILKYKTVILNGNDIHNITVFTVLCGEHNIFIFKNNTTILPIRKGMLII